MKTQPLPTSRWVTAALAPLLLFAGSQAMASHPPPEVGDCYFQKFGEVPGGGPITANQYCTADDVELGIVNAIILVMMKMTP